MENINSKNHTRSQSPASIANWVATNASMATITQYSSPIQSQLFDSSKFSNFSSRIGSTALITKPIFDLAIRGVMVEKGLIEIDEVDMGWIFSEAIVNERSWFNREINNMGKLFLFAPIATATGYLISENENGIENIDVFEIPDICEIVMDNTTPEDTVNLISTMYEHKSYFPIDLIQGNPSITEQVQDLLEDEINLQDLYSHFKEVYMIFNDIINNYKISFQNGFPAFFEVINEGKTYDKAITHTFFSLLSEYLDSDIYTKYGRITAQKLRKRAIEIIEVGSIFTEEGDKKIKELITDHTLEFNLTEARTISDITANVTFIASISGLKP